MWVGIIIDIVFVILLAVAAYFGYRNGAVKVILDLAIIILIIPIVYFTYKPVTNFVIKNTSIHSKIEQSVKEQLDKHNVNEKEKIEDEKQLPFIIDKVNGLIQKAKSDHYGNVSEKVSKEIATFAVQAIVVIAWSLILYIILTIVKIIIVKFIDIIPVINVINYIAGSVLQVVKVIGIVFLILFLLQFILPAIKSTGLVDNIEKTKLIRYMYHNNIVNKFIK